MTQTFIPGTEPDTPTTEGHEAMRCLVCQRMITDAVSVKKHMGPVCSSRQHLVETLSAPGRQVCIDQFPALKGGTKSFKENVPMWVTMGREKRFGVPLLAFRAQPVYGWGQKASDEERHNLALNILLNFCTKRHASVLANRFAATFLIHMNAEMGMLTYRVVRDWVKLNTGDLIAEDKKAEAKAKRDAKDKMNAAPPATTTENPNAEDSAHG